MKLDKNIHPVGDIKWWFGAIEDIPSGWQICDGTNGAPDLRNKHLMNVGCMYPGGAKDGALTHSHTMETMVYVEANTHTQPKFKTAPLIMKMHQSCDWLDQETTP